MQTCKDSKMHTQVIYAKYVRVLAISIGFTEQSVCMPATCIFLNNRRPIHFLHLLLHKSL